MEPRLGLRSRQRWAAHGRSWRECWGPGAGQRDADREGTLEAEVTRLDRQQRWGACSVRARISKKRPGVIAENMGEKEEESRSRDICNCSVPSVHFFPPFRYFGKKCAIGCLLEPELSSEVGVEVGEG